MANTLLNTTRATSNPQTNINQVNNVQPNQVQANAVGAAVQTPNTANQTQSNQINPITIPIQIQPQVAGQVQTTANTQPTTNLQANANRQAQVNNAPKPQAYQGNTNNNAINFNQIYSAYQSQYGTNNTSQNTTPTGIRKTNIGSTIVTPTNQNLNTVEGQYQSAYSDTINSIISTLLTETTNLKNGQFGYDPSQDTALRLASEYAANSTMQSLAGSGVLNSSATSERVARIVSELIPQYEKLAYDRQVQYLSQLADTAQLVMQFDNQQFQYWADAKDREFKNKQFEFEKQQKELENAWKRVDELGYVDNNASKVLGVKVGTLSGAAREAKEQREFELNKMRQQYELERKNDIAIAKLKSELSIKEMYKQLDVDKKLYSYKNNLDLSSYAQKSKIDTSASKDLAKYQSSLDRETYSYKSNIDTKASKELASYNNELSKNLKETDYQLASKYNTSSTKSNSSKTSTVSLSTYKDIIKNNYSDYDEITGKYSTADHNTELWNYLTSEYVSGRLSEKDYMSLIAMYGITEPTDSDRAKQERIKYLKSLKQQ